MTKRLLICVAILLVVWFGAVVAVYHATRILNRNPDGFLGRVDRLLTPEAPTQPDSHFVARLLDALQDPDASVRREAIKQLVTSRAIANAALPALIVALDDDDPEVRLEAADAIGYCRDSASSAVPALVERLKDLNPPVRGASARALQLINADLSAYVPVLLERLGDPDPTMGENVPGPYPTMREQVAGLLAKVENRTDGDTESIVPKLVELLESGSTEAREGAALVVGRLGSRALDAVPALLDSLKGLTEQKLHERARNIPHDPNVLPALIAAMESDDAGVRNMACYAIANMALNLKKTRFGELQVAVPALRQRLREDTDSTVRGSAFGTLGWLLELDGASEALVEALQDADSLVRFVAASFLIGKTAAAEHALPVLVELLEDPSLRFSVAQTLAEVPAGKAKALPVLLDIARHGEPPWRGWAPSALVRLFPDSPEIKEVIDVLCERIRDKTLPPDDRVAGIQTLEQVAQYQPIPPVFLDVVNDDHESVRKAAIDASWRHLPDEAIRRKLPSADSSVLAANSYVAPVQRMQISIWPGPVFWCKIAAVLFVCALLLRYSVRRRKSAKA